jgi:phage terminase small subunit
MPALKNPRWERFAQAIVDGLANGGSQAKAYESAGYSTEGHSSESAASRLLRNVEPVIRRVRELQAETAKRKAITRDGIVDELEEARQMARAQKQGAAMTAASLGKAKISGLLVDKQEIGNPGDFQAEQSTAEIAQSLLEQANPNITVTDEMRQAAVAELERHCRILEAIAAGDVSNSRHCCRISARNA